MVESNYKNNVPRYKQDASSIRTALEEVNGCGPKLFGKINIGEKYNGIFLPACNSHDVCYDCQKGKAFCDDMFLGNMLTLCYNRYSSKKLSK